MGSALALLVTLLLAGYNNGAILKSQEVLKSQQSPDPPPKKTATLPITNRDQWLYTTEIGIGNPPQRFNAVIDTGFSDVMVTSVGCSSGDCNRHPLFNGSTSLTYVRDGRGVHVHPAIVETWGNLSFDSYWVGDIQVEYQPFEEATKFDSLAAEWLAKDGALWYDASFPLSRTIVRDDAISSIQRSSPFMNMVSQGLLRRNEFTLKLPRKIHETGFLMLGHRGDHYDVQTATALPLTPEDRSQELSHRGGWYVEPAYLAFSSGLDVIYYDLEGYTAIITSFCPWLEVPPAFRDGMLERLERFGAPGGESIIKCDMVTSALPNITIALKSAGGGVQEFIMTPQDYALDTLRIPDLKWGHNSSECDDDYYECDECMIAVASNEEDWSATGRYITLGTTFLRNFLTTFSEEERAVILTPLPR